MPLFTFGALLCAVATPSRESRWEQYREQEAALAHEGPCVEWVVLGPFAKPPGAPRRGLDVDYLAEAGGEESVTLEPGRVLASLTAQPIRLAGAALDFLPLFAKSDDSVVYAQTTIRAKSAGMAHFLFGSDDGARVWVNGESVHEAYVPDGRGLVLGQESFSAPLRKGDNVVLIKIENGTGAWGVALETVSAERMRAMEEAKALKQRVRELQNQDVTPALEWPGYVFPVSAGFPRIIWRDAERVRELAGAPIPLTIRWFDAQLDEVTKPKEPGRYAAVAEGRLPDGTRVLRMKLLFGMPGEWNPYWMPDSPMLPQALAGACDPAAWKEHEAQIADWVGQMYKESLAISPSGPVFLSWLASLKPTGTPSTDRFDTPGVAAVDWLLEVRRKVDGRAGEGTPLAPAGDLAASPAPVLHEGSAAEARMHEDAKAKIDAACRAWAEESKEPFSVLVARDGVIVTHAAFGQLADETPLGVDFRNELASITKALTGQLFGRFVEQGLLAIDQPIGEVLPGFPTSGPKAITFRHLFTHTTGLDGHGDWGGIYNPVFDNIVLEGLAGLDPGKVHLYNGLGYDLAGKAMEAVTGKSILRLMNDDLFQQVGVTDAPPVNDLAFGARLTAYELGSLAQMMCNRGAYGDKRLMSEETFETLLPVQLGQFWPDLSVEWGIGLTPYRELREGAEATSKDPADFTLGRQVVGHGSATSCVLRVALDTGVVVAMVRRTAGPKYDEHLRKVLTAVSDSML